MDVFFIFIHIYLNITFELVFTYICMISDKDYPVFELQLKPLVKGEKRAFGFDKIAFVEDPALESEGIYLSEQAEIKLANEYKQQVIAPLLIPNKKIWRKTNGGHYIYFTEEVIKELKSEAGDKLKELDLFKNTHRGEIAPAFIIEDWIIEDENDKTYTEYGFKVEDIPLGSWMVHSQIIDKEFWDKEIMNNKKFKYSIEAFLHMNAINLSNDKNNTKKVNMEDEKDKVTFELDGKTYELVDGKPVLVEETETEVETEKSDKKDDESKDDKPVETKEHEDEGSEDGDGEDKDKPEDKPVETEEEDKPEDKPEDEESEDESKNEDKFEAIYDEIAKIKEMISKISENEDKVEMNSDKDVKKSSVSSLTELVRVVNKK